MVNSSLTYEILLYLNSFYFGLFGACEAGMFILKAINLTYTAGARTIEAAILSAFLIVESIRIILGRRGNLEQHSIPVLISILLTIPSAFGVTYLLVYQEYVLKLEFVLCLLMLALQAAELFFAFLFIVTICRPPSYD